MVLGTVDSKGAHPGSLIQAVGGLERTTVVSGEHGRYAAGSIGTMDLSGVRDEGEMTEVR